MSVNIQSPVFKFAGIRNPKPLPTVSNTVWVTPNTNLITNIAALNESNITNDKKLDDMNVLLQSYINSQDFIKTTEAFHSKIDVNNPRQTDIDLMYSNLVVRLLTKSNTNEVYGMLCNEIKKMAARLNSSTEDNVKIIIPEKITFPFTEFEGQNELSPPNTETATFISSINAYTEAKNKIKEAKENNIIAFQGSGEVLQRNLTYLPLLNYFGKKNVTLSTANTTITNRIAAITTSIENNNSGGTNGNARSLGGSSTTPDEAVNANLLNEMVYTQQLKRLVEEALEENLTEINEAETITNSDYDSVLTTLNVARTTVEVAEKQVDKKLNELYSNISKVFPGTTYSQIGGRWKNVSEALNPSYINQDENGSSILVLTQGCYLKYPVQVADLRVIEQQTVGYLPAEIAHINNTQRGEKNTRVTRRLKKVETFESLIQESEVTKETDTQSAERFSVESDAYNVQQEENGWNVNASVSGSYGPVSATVSAGYASSSLEVSGNSSAQQYAKEVFTRVIDRVSNRVRSERSVKTIEEFEETVTHEIDNSTQDTKSYIYRWLNKLVRGTLKNYGKRLIFEFNIAHPSSYYLSRSIKEKEKLNLPFSPREVNSTPFGDFVLDPSMITHESYVFLSMMYKTKLDNPPDKKIIISEVFSDSPGQVFKGKLIPIKKGYTCKKAIISNVYDPWPIRTNQLYYIIGNKSVPLWSQDMDFNSPRTILLNDETENLPISFWHKQHGYIFNLEVHCELSNEALYEWQVKAYHDILDAYDKLKAQAEAKLNEFDPNAPGLPPEKKRDLIKEELKKETIRKMYRCNPFWVNDKYEVGKEYNPDCCLDSSNAEKVRFLETVFDWRNMTYELHPYFYTNKNQWSKILDLEDDDPHFEAFLKASYATVRIPVYRDNLKEIAACNFIINNSIGNYETIPQGLENVLHEMKNEVASEFTYDLDGNELAVPKTTVDLGIFPIPTSLVILECSNQDGVKPIGFPQSNLVDPGVVIPRQYSPAIIADSCETPSNPNL